MFDTRTSSISPFSPYTPSIRFPTYTAWFARFGVFVDVTTKFCATPSTYRLVVALIAPGVFVATRWCHCPAPITPAAVRIPLYANSTDTLPAPFTFVSSTICCNEFGYPRHTRFCSPLVLPSFTHASSVAPALPVIPILDPLCTDALPLYAAAPSTPPNAAVAPTLTPLFPFPVESATDSTVPFPRCHTPW